MNFREMNLRIFQGMRVPHPLFQPRFEPWYAWHQTFHQMPPDYHGLSMRELFDDLHASMRYVHYYTGMPDPVQVMYLPEVERIERFDGREGDRIYRTPYGDLSEYLKRTVDEEWRTVGFAVKSGRDLKKLRWLYQRMRFSFSAENYRIGSDFVGERGVPQFWLPKSPYQALAQLWMKLKDLIYALADEPGEIEETMHAIDGYFHSLLKYLKDLPFDGLEALTPLPQGDVTLDEIKEHIGEKILLDGIPAVLFMDTYSREELMQAMERVVELFHPRLVLGVSDEVPEGTGQEAIERVRLIARWCESRVA